LIYTSGKRKAELRSWNLSSQEDFMMKLDQLPGGKRGKTTENHGKILMGAGCWVLVAGCWVLVFFTVTN